MNDHTLFTQRQRFVLKATTTLDNRLLTAPEFLKRICIVKIPLPKNNDDTSQSHIRFWPALKFDSHSHLMSHVKKCFGNKKMVSYLTLRSMELHRSLNKLCLKGPMKEKITNVVYIMGHGKVNGTTAQPLMLSFKGADLSENIPAGAVFDFFSCIVEAHP